MNITEYLVGIKVEIQIYCNIRKQKQYLHLTKFYFLRKAQGYMYDDFLTLSRAEYFGC